MANVIFKDYIIPLLPSILTVCGWLYVNHTNKITKANDIHNNRVKIAQEIADLIHRNVKDYYKREAAETTELGHTINGEFRRLSNMIALIEVKNNNKAITDNFLKYKKKCTGKDFQSVERKGFKPNNAFFSLVEQDYYDLFHALEGALKI